MAGGVERPGHLGNGVGAAVTGDGAWVVSGVRAHLLVLLQAFHNVGQAETRGVRPLLFGGTATATCGGGGMSGRTCTLRSGGMPDRTLCGGTAGGPGLLRRERIHRQRRPVDIWSFGGFELGGKVRPTIALPAGGLSRFGSWSRGISGTAL